MGIKSRRFINSVASALLNVVIGAVIVWVCVTIFAPMLFAGANVMKISFIQSLMIVAVLRAALINFHSIKVIDEV